MPNQTMKTSIILPTYNEKGNIAELINTICSVLENDEFQFEILVVDDDSPDGTADLVSKSFSHDRRVRLFLRKAERGLATAIKFGILHSTGDIIVVMDTDFNHDPRMLPQLIGLLRYYDMIIGSRFVLGGGMQDKMRYYLSEIYTIWLRFFLGIHIKDKLSGFFSIRKSKLSEIDIDSVFKGYGDFFIRLLLKAQNNGYRMLEVPTFYQLRNTGESKTNFLSVFMKYTLASIGIFFSRERWRGRK
jgi:dolichol-phosphate mannosyltransferase